MRSTANGYHIIPFLMEVCVYMCWHMRTDIYSDLLHYFHNFGIYLWELFLPNIRWFIATNIYYPGDFAKIIYNYIIIQIIIISLFVTL